MIGKIALANMKYHKSKNILTGIAIFLTTLLLFVVPTVGYDMIVAEKIGINELYPTWHALFRNIDEETAQKLSVHHLVKRYGLRSDVGYMLAVAIVAEGQRKLQSESVPAPFRGLPITLIYIGILALAIYGFTGHMVSI